MTVKDLLTGSGLEPADAELLLAFTLARPRTWLLAHPEAVVDLGAVTHWSALVDRRKRGEPVAYILGEREFHGRNFLVDPHVLIPRPCTERLVDAAIGFVRDGTLLNETIDSGIVCVSAAWRDRESARTIVDVGTGSGCIAVSLARALPDIRIIATDISADALTVAEENARRHGVGDRIEFRIGKNLDPMKSETQPFLVVSNPPYIPVGRSLPADVSSFEPSDALFAGQDGMDVLRLLATQARSHSACAGIIVECEEQQKDAFLRLLQT